MAQAEPPGPPPMITTRVPRDWVFVAVFNAASFSVGAFAAGENLLLDNWSFCKESYKIIAKQNLQIW
jgi:hypothetical protein